MGFSASGSLAIGHVILAVWALIMFPIPVSANGFALFLVAILVSFILFANLTLISATLSTSYLVLSVLIPAFFIVTGITSIMAIQLAVISTFLVLAIYIGFTAVHVGWIFVVMNSVVLKPMLIVVFFLDSASSQGVQSMPLAALFAISAVTVVIIAGGNAALGPQVVLIVASGLTLPMIGMSAYVTSSDLIAVTFLAHATIAGITILVIGLHPSECGGNVLAFVWTVTAIALVSGIPINATNVTKSFLISFSDGFDVIPVWTAYVATASLVFETVGSFGQLTRRTCAKSFKATPGWLLLGMNCLFPQQRS
tara:strand:+ start:771 stop:1700 length:930 start_codon:yes stop_codon:yes gene_type:complete